MPGPDQSALALGNIGRDFDCTVDDILVIDSCGPKARIASDTGRKSTSLDGKPVGVINRVSPAWGTRSNMHVGGRAEAVEMSARDEEICERIGPVLSERNLIFAGIDVIGDYLTEINVTSPTGVQEVRNFGGADISALLWDWIEAR